MNKVLMTRKVQMRKPDDYEQDFDIYRNYLHSKTWDELRTKRLKEDDFQCQICGSRSNVQVHHLVYPLHMNFGTETVNDLITVCPYCHKLIDDLRKGQVVRPKVMYEDLSLCCELNFNSEEMAKQFFEKWKEDHKDRENGIQVYLKIDNKWSNPHIKISITDAAELRNIFGEKDFRIAKLQNY